MAFTVVSGGIPFHVRMVFRGDGYGRRKADGSYACVHDKATSMVEFYDGRYAHEKIDDTHEGQFITRYDFETLIDSCSQHAQRGVEGLHLDCGVPGWTLDGRALQLALAYASGCLDGRLRALQGMADALPRTPSRGRIPADWPVQPLKTGQAAKDEACCGHCGLSWDDGVSTSMTPTPSGRCPFEPFHDE